MRKLSELAVWVCGFLCIGYGVSDLYQLYTRPTAHTLAKEIAHDTHGAVTAVRLSHRHGITIAHLTTPKGPEIAYLIGNGRYLAIGPLMDLKTGRNVTPLWEKIYAK